MKLNKFAGINNVDHPDALADGQLVTASNVLIDDKGKLCSRPGTELISAGASHSLWADGEFCLFRRGTELLRLMPDDSERVLMSGLLPDRTMQFVLMADRVYATDGAVSIVTDGESTSRWGVAPPQWLAVASLEDGQLPRGKYRYAVTFIRSDGEESAPGPIGSLADGGRVVLTDLPTTDDPTVTRLGIYLTTPNGTTLYRCTTVPAGTPSAVLDFDGVPTGAALSTIDAEPAPVGHLLAALPGRALIAAGQFVYYSAAYWAGRFDRLRRFLPFPDPVTLMAPLADGCVFATTRHIHWLAGLDPDAGQLTTLADHGAVPGSLAYVDGAAIGDGLPGRVAMFASSRGLCVVASGGLFQNLTGRRYRPISGGRGSAVYADIAGLPQYLLTLN